MNEDMTPRADDGTTSRGPVGGEARRDLAGDGAASRGGDAPRRGFVAVGVSGSSGSPVALRWGFDTARRRNLTLVAVRAYKVPSTSAGTVRPTPSRVAGGEDTMREATMQELIAHVRAALGPDADAPDVELRVVRGGRRRVLLAAAEGADMLVVDAPRHREISGDPVFARSLVYRAPCPVVIMPPRVLAADEAWVRTLLERDRVGG